MKARIEELEADRQAAQEGLDEMTVEEIEADYLAERLEQLPDLSDQLPDATPEVKRRVFQEFELRVEFDKTSRRVLEGPAADGIVSVSDIAGERFDPICDLWPLEQIAPSWPG